MRPSAPVQSGMPGGKTYMGWWGEMGGPRQKGVTQYTLSPYRQKALSGMLHGYVFAGFSRFMHHVPYFIIPVSIGYATYTWAGQKYAYYNSKEGHHAMAAEGHH